MPRSKRPRESEDLPSPNPVRARLFTEAPDLLPTSNDARSVADSHVVRNHDRDTSSRLPLPTPDDDIPAADSPSPAKVPSGPANPGVIRDRGKGILSRLPPDSDVFDIFARLRSDGNLSDEKAFLKFMTTYDVTLGLLNQISSAKLPASFSKVKFWDVAPYVWLDPDAQGSDIRQFKVFRSRLPKDVFQEIFEDVKLATLQYGRLTSHKNEEARSRYIASFFSRIVSLFGSAVINKPEGLLDAEYTKRGRIEHHFYALQSVSIVFIEVKRNYISSEERLDVIGQVLAECAACDYTNSKLQHWVPIFAILCDGERFEFLVYDSGSKSVYTSGTVAGVLDWEGRPELFVPSLKQTTEFLFDYFLMAYINGLRSFGHKSQLVAARSKSKKRQSTENWIDALARAEHAHFLCRKAAGLAQEKNVKEANEIATKGVEELRESVFIAPGKKLENISTLWDIELADSA